MPDSPPQVSIQLQSLIDKGVLDRLPVTFRTYCYEQFNEWLLLFPAEQSYYERLFSVLDRMQAEAVEMLFAPVRDAEKLMGVNPRTWPSRQFTLDQVDFLNRNAHYAEWRAAAAAIFARLDPILDAEIASKGRPRLMVVLSPAELPVGPDRMWLRIADRGSRIAIAAPDDPAEFVPELLTGASKAARAKPIWSEYAERFARPFDSWTVECGSDLAAAHPDSGAVRISYTQLDNYRKRLMAEVSQVVRAEKIPGPRQLSARLKKMKLLPSESELAAVPLLAEFARSTLLSGNGTLLINNTFVEWASVLAVRRARPSLTVIGFGIRNKVKPFTSLLIYADQETSNPVPNQMDTLGSYVDLEIFHQYLWQEFEKYAEYRNNTAFLFACKGMDQMLVIAPPDFPLKPSDSPVPLPKIHQRLREWMTLA